MCEHKNFTSYTGSMAFSQIQITKTCKDCNAIRKDEVRIIKDPGFTYCGQTTGEWKSE